MVGLTIEKRTTGTPPKVLAKKILYLQSKKRQERLYMGLLLINAYPRLPLKTLDMIRGCCILAYLYPHVLIRDLSTRVAKVPLRWRALPWRRVSTRLCCHVQFISQTSSRGFHWILPHHNEQPKMTQYPLLIWHMALSLHWSNTHYMCLLFMQLLFSLYVFCLLVARLTPFFPTSFVLYQINSIVPQITTNL